MDCLFFSSPIGLGHASRDAAIAENLEGGARFVTGGAAARLLAESGFAVADRYVPPQFVVEDGALKRPARWLWQYYLYYRACKKRAAQEVQNPDVVASDEDFASLAVAQDRKIPSVLVTDILETRFAGGLGSLVEKRMNRSMREIVSKCDAVIMPEDGEDEANIRRVGPIVRQTRSSRDDLRKRLKFDRKTVVITAGGTSAGSFLIERALGALRRIGGDCEPVVVSGPSLGAFDGARNLGFVQNLHEVIYAADLVVSLAGRSTIDEANSYGTPGIFIPIRGHFEQEENAKRQGFVYDDIFRLESLIAEMIVAPRAGKSPGGAKRASEIIRRVAGRGAHENGRREP